MCGRHETPCFVFRFEGNQTGDKLTSGGPHVPTAESAWSCPGLRGAPPTGPALKTRRCAPGREPADRQHPTERISTRFPLDPTGPGPRDASRAQPRMSGALTAYWGSSGRRTRRGRSEMEWRKDNRIPRAATRSDPPPPPDPHDDGASRPGRPIFECPSGRGLDRAGAHSGNNFCSFERKRSTLLF